MKNDDATFSTSQPLCPSPASQPLCSLCSLWLKTAASSSLFSLLSLLSLPLLAADGDFMASGTFDGTYTVNTSDSSPFTAADAAALAALPPVAWCKGDTVTATSQGGTVETIASDAASAGTVQFSPASDGIWTLENSDGSTARIVIPFSRLGDYAIPLASGAASGGYVIDSLLEGPYRRVMDKLFPPVAYTGDDWVGDAESAASVTFTPPSGSGLAATTLDLTGTGAVQFTFSKAGRWTVTLSMADGSTSTAIVSVNGGMTISIR